MSVFSLANWISWQKLYKASNHDDFKEMDGLSRQTKAKNDWNMIKAMEPSQHGMQYKCIIDKIG